MNENKNKRKNKNKTKQKEGGEWANSGLALLIFINLFRSAWGNDIPYEISSFASTLLCLFGCIFHLGVVFDTEF